MGESRWIMMGDVAQWLVSRKSNPKTLGSIPWWGRVRDNFSIPPSQLMCRLVCAWPPFVCTTHTQICVHINDPMSICLKRVGLTVDGMETWKHYTQKEKKKLGNAILWLLTFSGESSPNFPCIVLGQESYLIFNVILWNLWFFCFECESNEHSLFFALLCNMCGKLKIVRLDSHYLFTYFEWNPLTPNALQKSKTEMTASVQENKSKHTSDNGRWTGAGRGRAVGG